MYLGKKTNLCVGITFFYSHCMANWHSSKVIFLYMSKSRLTDFLFCDRRKMIWFMAGKCKLEKVESSV
jgi:hypothetical protein